MVRYVSIGQDGDVAHTRRRKMGRKRSRSALTLQAPLVPQTSDGPDP
jgi:hypothetical protein